MRALSVSLVALGLLAIPGTALPAPKSPAPADIQAASMDAEIDRLNKFVNSIRTIHGRFVQTANGGDVQTGTFYWKRPRELRIDYDTSPLLIVADGTNIAQIDKKLETIDQVRIGWTPYKFLLARDFDLRKGVELLSIQKLANETRVTVKDPEGKIDGKFTLIFGEKPELTFKGWTWTDAYDGEVDFRLNNVKEGTKLNPSLFVIRESDRRRGGRRH